ncbi:MAG: nucleotide exchange factor GrpE [Clostridia bacterium]|nr:nucleotide exchange factor GrpE [Clostridia bacterium]
MTDNEKEEKKPAGTAKKSGAKKEPAKKAELDALKAKLEEAEAELARVNDLLLRTTAEYDNYRKRTAREKTELYTSVAADTVGKFLPVLDSIEAALASGNADAEKLRSGLELIAKQIEKSLSDVGVTEVETETFDPKLHDAVMHVEDDALPENAVAQVFRKGYKLGDTVIRPATVKVAN